MSLLTAYCVDFLSYRPSIRGIQIDNNLRAGSRADILGLGFPPLRFSYILFCLQHPVLGLQAFDSTEMFGVVSHYGKVVFAGCDADK